MSLVQILIQALPGGAAIITAVAAVITALGVLRAGRAAMEAKDDQLKVKAEQIQLLERLTPARIVEYLDGYKLSYERLLERERSELALAEAKILELEQSKASSESERQHLFYEKQSLNNTISDLQARVAGVEVITQAARDVTALDMLSPPDLEALVRQLYERQGYQVSRAEPDSGFDLWAYDASGSLLAVETKRYRGAIGAHVVRNLYGRKANSNRPIHRIVLVTTGPFTRDARAEARPAEIELIDGAELALLLQRYGLLDSSG